MIHRPHPAVLYSLKNGAKDWPGHHLVRVHFLAYDVLVDLHSAFHAGSGQTNLKVLNNATSRYGPSCSQFWTILMIPARTIHRANHLGLIAHCSDYLEHPYFCSFMFTEIKTYHISVVLVGPSHEIHMHD